MQVGKSASRQVGKWVMGAGVVLAVQFFADVRMAAYTLVVAMALVLVWGLGARCQGPGRAFGLWLWALSLVIFAGLAACQWLPLVALLPETTRASMTLHDAAAWSLPWRYLVGLLLADHGGFHEWMTYVSVGILVWTVVGVRTLWRQWERRWLVGWLVSLLVGAAWFSLGGNGGLFQVLWRVVPGLGLLRVPPRAWVLVVFAMAVLAGLGVEGAEEQRSRGAREQRNRKWRQVGRWLRLGVGMFPPLLVAGYWLLVGVPPLNVVMFGVVLPGSVGLVLWADGRGSRKQEAGRWWVGVGAVLLIALDLLVVDATLVEARSPEEVFADGRAAAEWLAAQPGRFRVYSPSYSIPQHVAELYGLELADGVDPLQLRVYADYLTRAAGLESQGYSVTLPPFPEEADVRTALKDAVPDAEMLGWLGVRYVAAAFPIADDRLQPVGRFDGVYVYQNEEAQPVADTGWGGGIVLADGTVLFRYRPWAVYAGWAVSGATVVGLLAGWLVSWLRKRRADG
nr:hypothetical protein [Anaerolineae bacterium]